MPLFSCLSPCSARLYVWDALLHQIRLAPLAGQHQLRLASPSSGAWIAYLAYEWQACACGFYPILRRAESIPAEMLALIVQRD